MKTLLSILALSTMLLFSGCAKPQLIRKTSAQTTKPVKKAKKKPKKNEFVLGLNKISNFLRKHKLRSVIIFGIQGPNGHVFYRFKFKRIRIFTPKDPTTKPMKKKKTGKEVSL